MNDPLRFLLRPRSVAVVGASTREGSVGGTLFKNLISGGFQGPVYPVNAHAGFVQSVRAYAQLEELPDVPELAVIALQAPAVLEVAESAIGLGVKSLCVVSAGFGEAGPEGLRRQNRLRDSCRAAGVRLLGPNCFGIQNPDPAVRLNATFGPRFADDGCVAFASQSGAIGLTALEYAHQLGMGFSCFASMGNKADISGNDLLEYFEADPRTKVILLYLESFGNGVKFRELATRISRTKPIAIVKAGRSVAGARAVFSHTGALTSRDDAVAALCTQANVIKARTLEELFDVGRVLAAEPLPKGRRVAVVTNAGGMGILAADACEGLGLRLPELREATVTALKARLRPEACCANPIDVLADADKVTFAECSRDALSDPDVDALIALYVAPGGTDPSAVPPLVERVASHTIKPVLACWMGSSAKLAPSSRVPRFAFPEAAALALGRIVEYSERREIPAEPREAAVEAPEMAQRILAHARARLGPDGGWLDAGERAVFADAWKLDVVAERRCAANQDEVSSAAVEMGFPLVLKAELAGVSHKREHGGVAVSLETDKALRQACRRMLELEPTGFVLQRYVPDGEEWLVGAARDPVFGPVVTVGAGGTRTELWRDVHQRLAPLTTRDCEALCLTPRIGKTLAGFRGDPPGDSTALAQFIRRMAALAVAHPEIGEVEVNPLKVLRPGEGVCAVDLRIRLTRRA